MPDAISGATAVSNIPTIAPSTTVERGDQMGKDTFLKLLVAQLKYQDPSNPASNSEFMAQTAQFSQVEKMEQLVAQNQSLLASQSALTAGAMVGQYVTYNNTEGEAVSGHVTSVRFDPNESTLIIDGAEVPMGRLTHVSVPDEA